MSVVEVDYGTVGDDRPFQKMGDGNYTVFTKIDNKSAYADLSSIDPNGELVLYETLFPIIWNTRTNNTTLTDCAVTFVFSYDQTTKKLTVTVGGNAPSYFNFNNAAGVSPFAATIYYKI